MEIPLFPFKYVEVVKLELIVLDPDNSKYVDFIVSISLIILGNGIKIKTLL
jgi:hypothetical protein